MPTVDEIVTALRSLSPEQLNTVHDKLWPRKKPGPDKTDSKLVRRATRDVLWEMMTVDGKPFYNWEMKLTVEEVDALPFEAWKETAEGKAEFIRGGQDAFEAWVTPRRKRLKEWLALQMKQLLNLVDHRISPDSNRSGQRKHSRKGEFLKSVREAKDEFFMSWHGLPWEGIPRSLRGHNQSGIRNNPSFFYQRQHDYLFGPLE